MTGLLAPTDDPQAPETARPVELLPVIVEMAALSRARRIVRELGGRFSLELGIELDRDPAEAERWALAATLFGNRISTTVATRTYRVLERAGVRTIADAGRRSRDELVALLHEGGYVRYDERTASRLLALAKAIADRYGGRLAFLGEQVDDPAELDEALRDLPGWGAVTVHAFLRELRGVWPGAAVPLDERAARAARHLGLPSRLDALSSFAPAARLDVRDLEAALVRLSLCHELTTCPGGEECPLACFEPTQLKHF
jgi:endonuclease III